MVKYKVRMCMEVDFEAVISLDGYEDYTDKEIGEMIADGPEDDYPEIYEKGCTGSSISFIKVEKMGDKE